jgi:dolichol kinase
MILILADTAAALVGKGIGRVRILGKTLEGSMAFFFTALLIVWIYPTLDRFSGSVAALGAALIELLPIRLNDNLTISLTAGAIMFFLGG